MSFLNDIKQFPGLYCTTGESSQACNEFVLKALQNYEIFSNDTEVETGILSCIRLLTI